MDLRGSSSSLVSTSRVSAIPPDPMCWEMAVLVRTGEAGVKAAAEPKRAAMIASLYCVCFENVIKGLLAMCIT